MVHLGQQNLEIIMQNASTLLFSVLRMSEFFEKLGKMFDMPWADFKLSRMNPDCHTGKSRVSVLYPRKFLFCHAL